MLKQFFLNKIKKNISKKATKTSRFGYGKDPYHGRSYHRYFEGYTEYPITNEKGKLQIKRVYTAPFYHPAIHKKAFINRKLIYVLFLLLICFLLLKSLSLDVQTNYMRVFALIQSLCLFSVFFFFLHILSYATSTYIMKLHKYKSVLLIKTISLLCVILFTILSLSTLLYSLFFNQSQLFLEFISVVCLFVADALFFLIYLQEKNTKYIQQENTLNIKNDDATYIERLK